MKTYESYKDSGVDWIGEIPQGWKISQYKFVAEVQNGFAFKSNLFDKSEGFPILRIRDITSGRISTYYQGEFSNDYVVSKNDLLIGMDGDFNVRWWDKQDVLLNQRCCRIINKDNADKRFLYYILPINLQIINDLTYYTTVKHLSSGDINNAKFSLPSLKEQTQIAKYLDHKTQIIDALIQKKEQLIQNLQAQRQAIINEAVTKGLNPNAKLKDSGIEWLGEIPEHWEVVRIGHYVNIFRGASPRPAGDPKLFKGDFMPWITVGEVANGNSKYLKSTKNFLTELGSKQSRIVYPETLLLSNSGATLGVPKITLIKGCINDGSVAFDSFNPKLNRDYLYHFFMTHTRTYREEMAGYGQPNLNTDIIKSTRMPLPPVEEQQKIIEFIERSQDNLAQIIKKSQLSIKKLKNYRQSIISEAVTGKIDVRDWQPKKNR